MRWKVFGQKIFTRINKVAQSDKASRSRDFTFTLAQVATRSTSSRQLSQATDKHVEATTTANNNSERTNNNNKQQSLQIVSCHVKEVLLFFYYFLLFF